MNSIYWRWTSTGDEHLLADQLTRLELVSAVVHTQFDSKRLSLNWIPAAVRRSSEYSNESLQMSVFTNIHTNIHTNLLTNLLTNIRTNTRISTRKREATGDKAKFKFVHLTSRWSSADWRARTPNTLRSRRSASWMQLKPFGESLSLFRIQKVLLRRDQLTKRIPANSQFEDETRISWSISWRNSSRLRKPIKKFIWAIEWRNWVRMLNLRNWIETEWRNWMEKANWCVRTVVYISLLEHFKRTFEGLWWTSLEQLNLNCSFDSERRQLISAKQNYHWRTQIEEIKELF